MVKDWKQYIQHANNELIQSQPHIVKNIEQLTKTVEESKECVPVKWKSSTFDNK